jgi:hypothetical protein
MAKHLFSAFCFLLLIHGPAFGQRASKNESTVEEPKTYDEVHALAARTPGFKNLQRIGLAFHGYHSIFGRFPPAALLGPDGKTPYSWRVELLPILKHYVDKMEPEKFREKPTRERYNKLIADCGYDICEPWDSPKNRKVLERIPQVYRHPSDKDDSVTVAFHAVVGTGTAFDPNREAQYTDIRGWPATTLLIVESRSKEPWTKPIDIAYSASSTVPRFGGFTKNGFLALSCDGAVHFISDTVSPDNLRAFITRDNSDRFNILGIPYKYE